MNDETALCIEALRDGLSGVPVTSEIPFDRPDGPMVQVSRMGGEDTDFISRPLMQLLVWGDSDVEAHSLALDAAQCIKAEAAVSEQISSAEVTSLSRDEWSETGESRYRVQMKLTINLL